VKVLFVGEGANDVGAAAANPRDLRSAGGTVCILARKVCPSISADSVALTWSAIARFNPKAKKRGYTAKMAGALKNQSDSNEFRQDIAGRQISLPWNALVPTASLLSLPSFERHSGKKPDQETGIPAAAMVCTFRERHGAEEPKWRPVTHPDP
jgi:hypothetical protein